MKIGLKVLAALLVAGLMAFILTDLAGILLVARGSGINIGQVIWRLCALILGLTVITTLFARPQAR